MGIPELPRSCHCRSRSLLFPLQELLEDESNQLFFGEVGKQMVIGLMTKAEKVGSLIVFQLCLVTARMLTAPSQPTICPSVLKGESFTCMLVVIVRNKMPVCSVV